MSGVAPETALAGLLATLRMTALFGVAPLFGHLAVPIRVRGALAVAVALALVPALPPPAIAVPVDLPHLGLAAAGEAATGIALGFAMRLVFDAIGLFGGIFSMQGGLGAASVVDPSSGAPSTSGSTLLETIATLVYVAIDGHHALLRAAAASFDVVPPGGGGPATGSLLQIAALGSHVFAVAVQLAAPIMVAMMLANLALGVLGRSLPEMNLMMVQMPAHVLFGLSLLFASATPLGRILAQSLVEWSARATAAVLGGP